jgi:hypothetical protein
MYEIEVLLEVLVTKRAGFLRYKNSLTPARSATIVIAQKTTRRKAYEFGRAS